MLDVKKLITGFLILALGASASAWILSNTQKATNNPLQAIGSPASTTENNNAFVAGDATPEDVIALLSLSSSTEATLEQPNNLTGALGNSLLNDLAVKNPDGIQTDTTGNEQINKPDDQAILAELQKNTTLSKLTIPNWDLEAAEVPVRLTASASPMNATAYSDAITKVFNDSFVQSGIQSIVSNTAGADPTNAKVARSSVEGALASAATINTPTNLGGFHKSLIKLLVYEKNTLSLAENVNADPVKTSIVFQNEQLKYNLALNDFKTQFEKAQSIKGFTFGAKIGEKESSGVAFFNSLLGIKTAHAQWLTFDAANLGEMILQYANNIILQILKNTLTSFIQNKVLKWISGSGAPRFVQNFGSQLVNAYTNKAINVLNSEMECINPTAKPSIRILLKTPQSTLNSACASQFQSQLSSNNLKSFYNSFANGGLNTYFSVVGGANGWSDILSLQDDAVRAAGNSQTAAQTKLVANQGWKGSESCADGSDPTGTTLQCPDGSQPAETFGCIEGWTMGDGVCTNPNGVTMAPTTQTSCPGGDVPVEHSNDGQCADGSDPIVTSPGQSTGQVFNSTVDSGSKLITAANDIAGLLNAALSSLLNSLASMAINGATGAINGALNGGGGSSSGSIVSLGSSASSQSSPSISGLPAQPGVQCVPQSQTLAFNPAGTAVTFYAQGGSTNVADSAAGSGGAPTYAWSAPGSSMTSGGASTGSGNSFTTTYNTTGTFSTLVTASTDNSTSSCNVIIN